MTGKISEDPDAGTLAGAEKIAVVAGGANKTTTPAALKTYMDLGTAAAKNTGTSEGDVPVLGVGGLLDPAVLPASVAKLVWGQCQLTKSGSNLLLLPNRGNLLTVNSVTCSIPDAGVTLAPTGLVAGTFYYIYATANSGTINALEASTTAPAIQSGTGIKIKSADATRTLVGAAYTDTGPAWADTDGKLWVISYFNRRRKKSRTAFTTGGTVSSDTLGEISTEIRNQFISWTDEIVNVTMGAQPTSDTAARQIVSAIGIDSTSARYSDDCVSYASATSVFLQAFQRSLAAGLTEAANHYATVLGRAAGAGFTATYDDRTTLLVEING